MNEKNRSLVIFINSSIVGAKSPRSYHPCEFKYVFYLNKYVDLHLTSRWPCDGLNSSQSKQNILMNFLWALTEAASILLHFSEGSYHTDLFTRSPWNKRNLLCLSIKTAFLNSGPQLLRDKAYSYRSHGYNFFWLV